MKKLYVEIEVDDNFEKGDCGICPILVEKHFFTCDGHYEYESYCPLKNNNCLKTLTQLK